MVRAVIGLVFLLGVSGGIANLAQAQMTDFHCAPVGGNAIRCTRLNQEPRRPVDPSGWDSALDRAQKSSEERDRQRHEIKMHRRHEHELELERRRKGSSAAPQGYPY
jgi:hypothetical protein